MLMVITLLKTRDQMISMSYLREVCKFNHGKPACRYLFMSTDTDYTGYRCGKLIPSLRDVLDITPTMPGAEGNNCDGLGEHIDLGSHKTYST